MFRWRELAALRHFWRNPWTVWIGFRYLKSKKNSRFLSFISSMSILGVGLGVTAMIVVLSVMDGFENELKKRLMGSDLHILNSPTQQTDGFDSGRVPFQSLDEKFIFSNIKHSNEVIAFWPVLSAEAILKTGRKVTGVVLKGVTEERLQRLKKQVTESVDPQMMTEREGGELIRLPGVYVGEAMAYEMGVIPGDRVTLISPLETEGPLEAVPRLKRYVVEGVYKSGLPEQELHTVFAAMPAVRAFLRKADVVSQWEVTVRSFEVAPTVANEMRAMLPTFRVEDWIQLNSHLFASLRLERIAMFIILAFIVVVASFNIVTTLTLMVLEKKKEIAILKTMGARDSHVAAVFLAEGVLIGFIGVGGGLILGLLLCVLLKRYDFITLPDIYYDRTLPVSFQPLYYAGVSLAALVIVITACLYPSRRALRLSPLQGIRYGA